MSRTVVLERDARMGQWTVLGMTTLRGAAGQLLAAVECSCGAVRLVPARSFRFGRPRDCRCKSGFEARFWRMVRKGDGCWEWVGSKRCAYGYGQISTDVGDGSRCLSSHRASWELAFGPIPEGLCVLHRCDNPPCVRPDHLFLGTNEENTADRVAKGRSARGARCIPRRLARGPDHHSARKPEVVAKGERHGSAKLSELEVVEIRRMYREGMSHGAIARLFDVGRTSIGMIVRGTTWKHLTEQGSA